MTPKIKQPEIQKIIVGSQAQVPVAGVSFSDFIQSATFNIDTLRLLIGHIRRFGLGLLAYPEVFGYDWTVLEHITREMGPGVTLAGFLIYLPRTIVNGFTLSQDFINLSHPSLPARLHALYRKDDRLFNLVNDAPSIIAGFISVFLLTPATAGLAIYLTVAVKFCEVLFSAAKAAYDDALTPLSKQHTPEAIYASRDRWLTVVMHTLLLPSLGAFIPSIMMLHAGIPTLAASFGVLLVCLRFQAFRAIWIGPKPTPEPLPPPQQRISLFNTPISPEGLDNQATACLNQSQFNPS